MNKHLFLTGFMGAGKTTVGQLLADEMNLSFVDLDQKISEVAGKSISEIFSDNGESFFRDLESRCLRALAAVQPAIVSTGGGIITRLENRDFMQAHGDVVYLAAEWSSLVQRIGDSTDRPLARDEDDWSSTRALWLARCPLYEQADITIKTDHRSLSEIISEIKSYAE